MKTVEIVDELLERFKGWEVDGPHGVLRYLNEAHAILMAQESYQTVARDPATGKLPTLSTTAGRLVYNCPDNIWRVGGVMLSRAAGLQGRPVEVSGRQHWAVYGVTTRDYLDYDNPARVIFSFDPGTREYILRAWQRPTDITSVRIQHGVPPPCDSLFLLEAAAMLIQGVQNGDASEARERIYSVIKPRFWAAMNKGEQSPYIEPVDRGF